MIILVGFFFFFTFCKSVFLIRYGRFLKNFFKFYFKIFSLSSVLGNDTIKCKGSYFLSKADRVAKGSLV